MAANINGNDTAQTFSVRAAELSGGVIDGGGGVDTLELRDFFYPQTFDFTALTTFRNIEVISGVIEEANIRIRADQLAGVTRIDSAGTQHLDKVTIVGTDVDLRGKSFVGRLVILPETANATIKVSDFATASLIRPAARGTHVQIETGTLTQEQLVALFDQGIDRITDASGVPVDAPVLALTALEGDVVTYKGAEVTMDAGSDATLTSGTHLKSLVVKFLGAKSLYDTIDLELGARFKIEGTNSEGENRLYCDNVEIGSVFRATFEGSLHFTFNEKATGDQVQEIVRSVSYLYDFSFAPKTGSRQIEFIVEDVAGRIAKANSVVRLGDASVPPTDPRPTDPHPTDPGPTDHGMTLVGDNAGNRLDGTGGDDLLKGHLGNDILKGLFGNDKLYGGAGRDTLTGGSGKDIFVFDTKPNKKKNLDKITDFNVKDDTFWLENKIFAKIGKKNGQLKKANFFKGATAHDKDDYIVYDPKKGALYYDKDGSGAAKAIQIASLKTKLAMTHKDFIII